MTENDGMAENERLALVTDFFTCVTVRELLHLRSVRVHYRVGCGFPMKTIADNRHGDVYVRDVVEWRSCLFVL